MIRYSLRRAMLGAIIAPLALAIGALAISAVTVTQRTVALLLDDQMQQDASFIMLLARHEATEGESIGQTPVVRSREFERILGAQSGFRIWSGQTVVTKSGNIPERAAPPPLGFSQDQGGDDTWRNFAIGYPGEPIVVVVSQSARLRAAFVRQIILSLVLPMLILVVAIAAIIYIQVTAAMRPISRISAQIDARAPDDLERLRGHRLPFEIEPLFDAFNRLIDRMRGIVEREREFVDNAAHELRTPIAVVKTRAQIVERGLVDDDPRRDDVRSLVEATDRAAGVIDQLLSLTQMSTGGASHQSIDLSKLVDGVARVMAASALAKQQSFEADIAPGIFVDGQGDALMMVVRNVLDNAIRYTQPGGAVEIELVRIDMRHVLLRIADTGPGVAPESHKTMFNRFERLSGVDSGSGLGLSIVATIVERHHGSINVASRDPQGLCFSIHLPVRQP